MDGLGDPAHLEASLLPLGTEVCAQFVEGLGLFDPGEDLCFELVDLRLHFDDLGECQLPPDSALLHIALAR